MAAAKVAGIDTICWVEKSAHTKSGWEHRSANRGEIVDLPADQAERLADYLVDPDAVLDDEPAAWSQADTDTIDGMTVAEIHAYLGQVPEDQRDEELDRILDAEQAREKPRTSVLSLDPDFEPDPADNET